MAVKITYGSRISADSIVSLDVAKMNSRIDYNYEDDLLSIFLQAAFDEIENYTSRKLVLREDSLISSDDFQGFIFPGVRVDAITKVEYVNQDDQLIEMQAEDYRVDDDYEIIINEPSDFKSGLKITCNLGYSADNMPADIRRAVLLLFSFSDTYREDMPVKLNTAAKSLLRPYRLY